MMDEKQVEEIKKVIRDVLNEHSESVHPSRRTYDDYVSELIETGKRRRETMDKIKQQVGGWVVISLLGGAAYAMWALAQVLIKKAAH